MIDIISTMETNSMDTQNSKTSEARRFRLNVTHKPNLKGLKNNMALANLSIYCIWKKVKSEDNHNKLKISTPTWNDEFNLPGGSYSISDIQDYFEFIIKNMKL